MDTQQTSNPFLQIRASSLKDTFMKELKLNVKKLSLYNDGLLNKYELVGKPKSHLLDVLSVKFIETMKKHRDSNSFIAEEGILMFQSKETAEETLRDLCEIFMMNATIEGVLLNYSDRHFVDCTIILQEDKLKLETSESMYCLIVKMNTIDEFEKIFDEPSITDEEKERETDEIDREMEIELERQILGDNSKEKEKNEAKSTEKKKKKTQENVADVNRVIKKEEKKSRRNKWRKKHSEKKKTRRKRRRRGKGQYRVRKEEKERSENISFFTRQRNIRKGRV